MTATCGSDRQGASAGCGCATVAAALYVSPRTLGRIDAAWTDGTVRTALGEVPRVRTTLRLSDRLGTLKARSAIGRMRYRVPAGLYAAGHPTPDSPVLVTANYKLSVDHLRRALAGRDAWLLVLETHGINVWCAAGKGTFGTAEVVRRVTTAGLDRVVSHRRIVLPQLGAPGVAAHDVHRATGFRVVYGPVRAADLPAFLDARMKATPAMRQVRFRLRDRAVLVPVEIAMGAPYTLAAATVLLVAGGLGASGYSPASVLTTGLRSGALVLASFLAAAALGPLLLPWLPGRPFALKGAVLGAALVGAIAFVGAPGPGAFGSWLHLSAWALLAPALASFVVMNFTGSSTFTSLSGVLREMRYAMPLQIAAGAVGVVLWVTGLFVGGGAR